MWKAEAIRVVNRFATAPGSFKWYPGCGNTNSVSMDIFNAQYDEIVSGNQNRVVLYKTIPRITRYIKV